MGRCPAARYLEILPLLCMMSGERMSGSTLVDLGSGTGYLASFFENHCKKVIRVDKSPEMLAAGGGRHTVVSDMRRASDVLGREIADFITCLASFHHVHVPENPVPEQRMIAPGIRHWGPEVHLDVVQSHQAQYDAIKDWVTILRPGGLVCLVDVPGYPDPAWAPYLKGNARHGVDTRGYQVDMLPRLNNWQFPCNYEVLGELFTEWSSFFAADPHLQELKTLCTQERISMRHLLEGYPVAPEDQKSLGPMVPADFFDDVVHTYGAQPHYGYFPRETSLREALAGSGLQDVWSATLPAPWLFKDKREAAWFVHELFGLGRAWDFDAIPSQELEALTTWLDDYLGFVQDRHGRTFLSWQLLYCTGRKPAI
jgi:SAM-dependent methyltransferase